jgi:RNA polymerase sigma factor
VLSLLFQKDKKTLEEKALLVQTGHQKYLDSLLADYQPFVKKVVSSVCKRYIDHRDDEFSIGLIAFHEAILKYDRSKGGSLLAFAEVVIKRKVIDFLRSTSRYKDISIEQHTKEDDENGSGKSLENTISFNHYRIKKDEEKRKEEIIAFQSKLRIFGLSFEELVEQAPKHDDARINAFKAAAVLVQDDALKESLFQTKRLPMKELEKKVEVSRKTLERNRKYIIAIAIILSGDFVYLKDYLKGRLDE